MKLTESEEAKFHLERLIQHHYVKRPQRRTVSHPFPQYSLTQSGREYVINNKLLKQEADSLLGLVLPDIGTTHPDVARNERLDQTLHILRSYRNNLSSRALDKGDVDEYHSRLETAQSELKCDLSNFRIPPSAIKSRHIPQSFSMDMFGKTYGDPYRTEYHIPADVFKTYLDALINFIDQKQV